MYIGESVLPYISDLIPDLWFLIILTVPLLSITRGVVLHDTSSITILHSSNSSHSYFLTHRGFQTCLAIRFISVIFSVLSFVCGCTIRIYYHSLTSKL